MVPKGMPEETKLLNDIGNVKSSESEALPPFQNTLDNYQGMLFFYFRAMQLSYRSISISCNSHTGVLQYTISISQYMQHFLLVQEPGRGRANVLFLLIAHVISFVGYHN